MYGGVLTGQVYEAGITVTPPGDTPDVTTQLRLVEPPEPRARAAARPAGARAAATRATPTTPRGRARSVAQTARSGRRAASWGEWRLDARTRRVGRAGVARAREVLEAALEQELRAS